jgi:hypothetical protein
MFCLHTLAGFYFTLLPLFPLGIFVSSSASRVSGLVDKLYKQHVNTVGDVSGGVNGSGKADSSLAKRQNYLFWLSHCLLSCLCFTMLSRSLSHICLDFASPYVS